jgi:hypothetical protein
MQSVVVLLDELLRFVTNRPSEVADQEAFLIPEIPMGFQLGLSRQVQAEMVFVLLLHGGSEFVE